MRTDKTDEYSKSNVVILINKNGIAKQVKYRNCEDVSRVTFMGIG